MNQNTNGTIFSPAKDVWNGTNELEKRHNKFRCVDVGGWARLLTAQGLLEGKV